MEFDFGNISEINNKIDEIYDEDSLKSMVSLLTKRKNPIIISKNKSYSFENILREETIHQNHKNNNSQNLLQKQIKENLYLKKFKTKKININLITKEEKTKTKSNTDDKKYSINMNYIKSDDNEDEQNNKISNNDMNSRDAYYIYNDDYKILYNNSDDKFDLDNFNNNCINKTLTNNKFSKSIIKNKKLKLLGKKREKSEKIEKVISNENIFFEINKLYKQYIGNEKKYQLYENKKGFFEKNITIVEEGIPICVIYFKHEIITKIYLIIEQITLDKEDEILGILVQIKKNIQKNLLSK